MPERRRDDHRVDPSPSELGGDRMTDVVQAGGGMQPCKSCQSLERMSERIGMQEEAVATLANEN